MNISTSEHSDADIISADSPNNLAYKRGSKCTDELSLDFSNSFIYWWMDSLNHTPRCALRARCTVETADDADTFYLTHACAAERMYIDHDLIQQPSAEFHLIFNDSEELMTVKFFDRGNDCNRSAVRVGVPFQRNVNGGTTITRLERRFRFFSQVERLETDEAVYHAMMNQLPIIGRTVYSLPCQNGTATVTAEYPVTVMNAHNETLQFQVDTGLILLPDYTLDEKLGIEAMREAFIVFNSFNYAEYILRAPVKINGDGDESNHFSALNQITCRNELFAATSI